MLCEICSANEAVFHIKQVIGKDEIELHLCEKCARLRGITKNENTMDFSISQLLTGLVDTKSIVKKSGAAAAECPACGFTLNKFKKLGKLGCSECYTAFAKPVRDFLYKMYGKIQHKGKLPGKMRTKQSSMDGLEAMKEELKTAIALEDYEQAASLRDRIKEMITRLGEGKDEASV
ncbi:MAG: UvrB/UvrC motif-containing protein [Spirochaetales bacterium]|nr:UvrB/UvrC motif-containing protein [Spirochaetales bacterium]